MDNGILIVGRFSGVHRGHTAVIKKAHIDHPDDKIIIGIIDGEKTGKDKDKNPFTIEERKNLLHTILKSIDVEAEIMSFKTAYIPDIKAEIMQDKDIDIKYLYCGSDREASYSQQGLSKYGIKIVSLSRANDNICDAYSEIAEENASATKIREALKLDNYILFKSLLPSEINDDDAILMFTSLKTSMAPASHPHGIMHIDKLPPSQFIEYINNIYDDSIVISQKLDGTFNMSVYKKDDELLYCRMSKNQKVPFTYDTLPRIPRFNALRSACKVLDDDKVQKVLLEQLDNNSIIDIEVLYGSQPNSIEYNLDKNYLAFLRVFNDNNGFENEYADNIIDNIVEKLGKNDITISSEIVKFDWNVEEFIIENNKQVWSFTRPEILDKNKLKDENTQFLINQTINELYEWLHSPVSKLDSPIPDMDVDKWLEHTSQKYMTNESLIRLNLSTIPVADRSVWKQARQYAINIADEYKLKIKKLLLEIISNNVEFSIGGKNQEGLVIRNSCGGMTKIVDTDEFTARNRNNWMYRELAEDGYTDRTGNYLCGITAEFFNSLAYSLEIPLLKHRHKFFKMIKDSRHSFHDAIDLYLLDNGVQAARIPDKIIILRNTIDTYMSRLKDLLEKSKIDDSISDTVKQRTSDTIAEIYMNFKNLKDGLNNIELNVKEHELLVNLLVLILEIFSN